MPPRPLHHIREIIRQNLLAVIAIFLALGGTSVAAIALTNHSLTPVKFDSRYIGGYVRGWASVSAAGRVLAFGGPRVTVQGNPGGTLPGRYYFVWHTKLTSSCGVFGNLMNEPNAGYVTTDVSGQRGPSHVEVEASTYNAQGQAVPQSFVVELLCSTQR